MILTNCAACAAPLGLSLGKKCGRCSTRYCGPECQKQHWEGGGHDQLCKKIKKAGGAEQYHANTKYKAAVAAAVKKCADDTKGQTCYICTQALHWKTKEGLVRGCSCRGTAGFAHVSCLAEEAKILVAEAEENHLGGTDAFYDRWQRWKHCSLCEQEYHGVVGCALGWACWKTYLGRPEVDGSRRMAMTQLGNGLSDAGYHEDALSLRDTELSTERRLGAPQNDILTAQNNLANTYHMLGRLDEAIPLRRGVYSGYMKLLGEQDRDTLSAALNYASSLSDLQRFEEAKALLHKMMPVARRVVGDSDDTTLRMRSTYATALYMDSGATLDNLREAVTTLEDTERTARRVLGGAHPLTLAIEANVREARDRLAAREASAGLAALAL